MRWKTIFIDLLQKKIKEQVLINLQELLDNIDAPENEIKIVNFLKEKAFEEPTEENINKIKGKIMDDKYFALLFIKSPIRQNLEEKLISEYIGLPKLPARGKNCIRFNSNGDIVHENTSHATKSADFKIGDWYITQKYTKDFGGAQDNQYKDIVDFIRYGTKKHKIIALVDENYWYNKNKDRLKNDFIDNPNLIVLSADELKERKREFE